MPIRSISELGLRPSSEASRVAQERRHRLLLRQGAASTASHSDRIAGKRRKNDRDEEDNSDEKHHGPAEKASLDLRAASAQGTFY
jgi:hypothetical protein